MTMLKVKDVCNELNIGEKKVRQLIGLGAIQAENISIGKRRATWRIDAQSVQNFRHRAKQISDVQIRRHRRTRIDPQTIQFLK